MLQILDLRSNKRSPAICSGQLLPSRLTTYRLIANTAAKRTFFYMCSFVTAVDCMGSNHTAVGCTRLIFCVSVLFLSIISVSIFYRFLVLLFHFYVCIFFSLFCLFTMFSFISLFSFLLSFIFLCSLFYFSSQFSNGTFLCPGKTSCKTIVRGTRWRTAL